MVIEMTEQQKKKPNVVFILTDDQGFWSLGCYGNEEIRTPNLDRLAERGVRFDNFYCVSPVCSPARASLLTGRIPSQHGIHDYLCGGNGGKTQSRKRERKSRFISVSITRRLILLGLTVIQRNIPIYMRTVNSTAALKEKSLIHGLKRM